jgi:hypothetical protein
MHCNCSVSSAAAVVVVVVVAAIVRTESKHKQSCRRFSAYGKLNINRYVRICDSSRKACMHRSMDCFGSVRFGSVRFCRHSGICGILAFATAYLCTHSMPSGRAPASSSIMRAWKALKNTRNMAALYLPARSATYIHTYTHSRSLAHFSDCVSICLSVCLSKLYYNRANRTDCQHLVCLSVSLSLSLS